MMLDRRYGVILDDGPETNPEIFESVSVAGLAKFIPGNRAK